MILKLSPSNSCRYGGCTLTGALSVTTHVRDTVTVVHGPKGCTHHNFSLLHATAFENDRAIMPDLVSTKLEDPEIVFGGEEALLRTLESVAGKKIHAIFVLASCVVETIGDDVAAICAKDFGVPVIPVPTAGFLGGTFQTGMNNALCTLAGCAVPCGVTGGVNIIGEKNLEYEVEENFLEVKRLLGLLGIPVNVRLARSCTMEEISRVGTAHLNILRDEELRPTGECLEQRFGTPFIESFPVGLNGTLGFLEAVGRRCDVDSRDAIAFERTRHLEILDGFSDISGTEIRLDPKGLPAESIIAAGEVAGDLGMPVTENGCRVPVPLSPPVGTMGVRRLLHRWRCAISA